MKQTDDTKLKQILIIANLCDEFKAFVGDSMLEGHHNQFSDPLEFLSAAMDAFLESKTS